MEAELTILAAVGALIGGSLLWVNKNYVPRSDYNTMQDTFKDSRDGYVKRIHELEGEWKSCQDELIRIVTENNKILKSKKE